MSYAKKKFIPLAVAIAMFMSVFSFITADVANAKQVNYKPELCSVKVWYAGKSRQVNKFKAKWTKIYKYRDWDVEYKLHSIGPTKYYTQTRMTGKKVKDSEVTKKVKAKREAGFNRLQVRFKKGKSYTKWSNTK